MRTMENGMVSGIVVLNKPPGMTSQQAVSRVKRLLYVRKAGHSGSLDPAVTGVLPVFLGSATRLSEYVTQERKKYAGEVCFGRATDTQDATGTIVARDDASTVDEASVRRAALRLTGDVWQTPPAYSAVKVSGVRSYALARRGEPVALEPRLIRVDRLEFFSFTREAEEFRARFLIECGKGTYVRTICHDLGILVGVPAHMSELVRLSSGPFSLEDAVGFDALEELRERAVLPSWHAVAHLPLLCADEKRLREVRCGAPFDLPEEQARDAGVSTAFSGQSLVRIHSAQSGELVAIYRVAGDGAILRLTAEKVLTDGAGGYL